MVSIDAAGTNVKEAGQHKFPGTAFVRGNILTFIHMSMASKYFG